MPSFTEYVRLIAEGGEAIATINKLNEAIAKLRREASQPINVKVNAEDKVATEKKVRAEKKQTHDAEAAALKKKKEDLAAIKAMNKEVGNPSFNIRYGNQESIAQFQRYNEQLAESTRRINRLADAHKHIRATAKAAGVEVSPGLSERLAAQVANRSEKSEAQAIRDAVTAEKERIAAMAQRQKQEVEAIRRVNEMEAERIAKIRQREKEEIEASRRVHEMEQDRIRQVKSRQEQEIEGAKRIYQMQQDIARAEEKRVREARNLAREQERAEHRARRERETAIASARESGIRGVAGEFHRDIRRNMIYGAIGQGETALRVGYEANVARDTAIENLRQAGRTPEQIRVMEEAARKLSLQNPNITATEMLAMQQHNIGAFGDFNKGMANNALSARYLAIRKGKVGEEEALAENLSILKVGEETGRIKDKGWMQKLYDQQLKIAQAEGAQYDPKSLLTTVRTLKSAKFGLSDETMLNILPFAGMGEGASRIGNQISMLQKSMIFTGKSLSKQNQAEIAGTVLSDGKAGYNQELFTNVASGNLVKLSEMMDKFYRQKGIDPNDKSQANINKEMNILAKAIGNSSAKEALAVMTENREQIEKQQRMAAGAQGLYTPNTANRTLQGAQDAVVAQYHNMSAETMKSSNPLLVQTMNGVAFIEEWIAKNVQGKDTLPGIGALGATGIFAAMKGLQDDPQKAIQTGLLTAIVTNTAATAANTAGGGLGGLAGGGGKMGLLGKMTAFAGWATAAVEGIHAGYLAVDDIQKWWELHKIKEAAKTPEGIKNYNKDVLAKDEANVKLWQAQKDAHDAQMRDQPHPAGLVDIQAKNIADKLAEAMAQYEKDKGSPFKFKKPVADALASPEGIDALGKVVEQADMRRGRGFGRTGGTPTYMYDHSHENQKMVFGEYGPQMPKFGDYGPKMPTAQQFFDSQFPKLAESSSKDAIAKISAAADTAASGLNAAGEAVKSSTSSAGGMIAAGGEAVASALQGVASAIMAAKAGLGQQGVPAVAPVSTGPANRGPK